MAQVTKPNTFSANTTISSSEVNENFDTIYNEFNGSISAANLATDAVTTAKITDSNVTTAKIADSNVTTAKIADDNVTAAKIDWASTGANGGIWWEELGRTTLGSAGSTITVSGIPARKYIQLIISVVASGGAVALVQVRLNNDSGNNYSRRTSTDGGADATAVNNSFFLNSTGMASGAPFTSVTNILNVANLAKLGMTLSNADGTTGAGTAPSSNVTFTKWANTTDQISRIDVLASSNNFATGSEVIVLGHN